MDLHAYAENPDDDPRHTLELLDGVSIGNERNVVVGEIVTSDDRRLVRSGKVVVTVERDAFERHSSVAGEVVGGRR